MTKEEKKAEKEEKREKYYIEYEGVSVEVPKKFHEVYYKTGTDIEEISQRIEELQKSYDDFSKRKESRDNSEIENDLYKRIRAAKKKLEKLKETFESFEKKELPRYAFNEKHRPERHKAEIKLGNINGKDYGFTDPKKLLKIFVIAAIASTILPGSLPILIGAGLIIKNLLKARKLRNKVKVEDRPHDLQESRERTAAMKNQNNVGDQIEQPLTAEQGEGMATPANKGNVPTYTAKPDTIKPKVSKSQTNIRL